MTEYASFFTNRTALIHPLEGTQTVYHKSLYYHLHYDLATLNPHTHLSYADLTTVFTQHPKPEKAVNTPYRTPAPIKQA